jgi:hypothetical protein
MLQKPISRTRVAEGESTMTATPDESSTQEGTQTAIAAFVLRDEAGRVWVAPVPQEDRPGAVMPHLLPGDTVEATRQLSPKGLEVEQFTIKAQDTTEFDRLLDAVALPEQISEWVRARAAEG